MKAMDKHFYIELIHKDTFVLKGKNNFKFVSYIQHDIEELLNDKMFRNDFKHLVPTLKKALQMMEKGIVGELSDYSETPKE